jgi:hypothetical protein
MASPTPFASNNDVGAVVSGQLGEQFAKSSDLRHRQRDTDTSVLVTDRARFS